MWNKLPPMKEGYYWMKGTGDEPVIVELILNHNGLYFKLDSLTIYVRHVIDAEWSSRIEPPTFAEVPPGIIDILINACE